FNYLQSKVNFDGGATQIRARANAGILYPSYANNSGANLLTLPVYICPRGTTVACTPENGGTLNPNNPYANAENGMPAQLVGRLPNERQYNETISRSYRF